MKRMKAGLMILATLFGAVVQVRAETVSIDFEEFNDRDNLHGVNLDGVTLTNKTGKVEVFDNRFGVSSHSPSKAVASPHELNSINPLVGIFERPVSSVSLWAGDAGTYPNETDSWELRAYDAPTGGNLVALVDSGVWSGSPYRCLTAAAETIFRFEANWTGPNYGIGYDDLQFQVVPEPSTVVLLSMAAAGLLACVCRRRFR